MKTFQLFQKGKVAELLVEKTAYSGVKRVADTVCSDISCVTGTAPLRRESLRETACEYLVFAGTCGNSPLAEDLEKKGILDLRSLKGKRECYMMQVADAPFAELPHIKKVLFIVGSDKRGTIYGMFRLSELCGVSPLLFWGDAAPACRDEVILRLEDILLTKEPSVMYRGFFINDEWPAFGKWCTERYGDVNAQAYDKIFELVLRLKGNYLWPAMWRSSFWEDGPGIKNAELAQEYGIIMGTSHHEPLCRAGVEWQQQYRKYGDDNTWSFITNADAITGFWRDGLKRSKGLENVITIGMRGENDSLLLKEGATLQDNITVVKNAITVQNRLIREEINENLEEVPRMLAIYKEVEDFYFGSADCEGLRDFAEIEDVILLLSDDNYGGLRALPQKEDRPHKGGYGIYYHFDYHGAPYSYEWLSRTNPAKVWEQLTMAYEYGIRKMWIVNVGDIKGNEYPLSYFMNLAYDYDKWGISNRNSAEEFTGEWIEMQFPLASAEQKQRILQLLHDYAGLATLRITESLSEKVYRNNYHEIDRILKYADSVKENTEALRNQIPREHRLAYDSMLYYPVMALLNIIRLNLLAGMNHELGKRGVLAANDLIPAIEKAVNEDHELVARFHAMAGGKWNHMMDSAHTGFRNWDDNDWTYPTARKVYPIPCGKTVVSFRGNSPYHLGHHWQDRELLCNDELLRPQTEEILLDIDSRGNVDYRFQISCPVPWLSFSRTEGNSCLKEQARITIGIRCDRSKLAGEETAGVHLDFFYENGESSWSDVEIKAGNGKNGQYPPAFLETEGYVCISAAHYEKKADIDGMGWEIVPRLGRMTDAIKTFPVNKKWEKEEKRPYVEYRFAVRKAGRYTLDFYVSPRNPMLKGGTIKGAYGINGGEAVFFDAVPEGFYAEWQDPVWSYGVTNNIRIISQCAELEAGCNTLRFYAADPNIILENIVIYRRDTPIRETHLAPPESCRTDG